MISVATDADASDEPIDDVDAWLERNADWVRLEKARGTESWQRATEAGGNADLGILDAEGRFRLRLPDGTDEHDVLLVKTEADGLDADWAGACDCDGWRFHSKPCAHLCALAQLDAVRSGLVPVNEHRAEDLAFGQVDVVDETETQTAADVIDANQDDVDGERRRDDVQEADPPAPAEASRPQAPRPQGADAFAGELPDVPDQYVMELGGDTYIRRAGYARLGYSAGLRLQLEEVVGAHDTDWQHAKYRAVVTDQDGEHVANDVGSAHADWEDLQDAEAQLDELAATRAASRALAWATGEGLNAVEEVAAEHAEEVGQ